MNASRNSRDMRALPRGGRSQNPDIVDGKERPRATSDETADPYTLTLAAVYYAFEDEDKNRYFAVGSGRYRVHDGCTGADRGVVTLSRIDVDVMKGDRS